MAEVGRLVCGLGPFCISAGISGVHVFYLKFFQAVLPSFSEGLFIAFACSQICLFAGMLFQSGFLSCVRSCPAPLQEELSFQVIEMTPETGQWFHCGCSLRAHRVLALTFYCLLGQICFLCFLFWPLNFKSHSFILLWGLLCAWVSPLVAWVGINSNSVMRVFCFFVELHKSIRHFDSK